MNVKTCDHCEAVLRTEKENFGTKEFELGYKSINSKSIELISILSYRSKTRYDNETKALDLCKCCAIKFLQETVTKLAE